MEKWKRKVTLSYKKLSSIPIQSKAYHPEYLSLSSRVGKTYL